MTIRERNKWLYNGPALKVVFSKGWLTQFFRRICLWNDSVFSATWRKMLRLDNVQTTTKNWDIKKKLKPEKKADEESAQLKLQRTKGL